MDEKRIEVDGEEKWLYAAIDIESKLLLEVDVTSCRGTDLAATFLESLTELHDFDDAVFLVDGMGYLTALARHQLSSQFDYNDRKHIEEWFQTVTMRIDRFHTHWRGNQSSPDNGYNTLDTSITTNDRTKHLTAELQFRRSRNR